MNKQRLLTLANFLRTEVPKNRFNLSSWVGDMNNRYVAGENLLAPSCGTSACAMGFATTIPMFAKAGLTLRKNHPGSNGGTICYLTFKGFEAAAEFMEIDEADANWLFNAAEYDYDDEVLVVADRIEKFVVSNGDRVR